MFCTRGNGFFFNAKSTTKALLLLGNSPGHPEEQLLNLKTKDGMIQIMYLPKNTLSLIQSVDQNVIKMMKARYKKQLLMYIVSQPDINISDILKNFNVKNAALSVAYAWRQVKKSTIPICLR